MRNIGHQNFAALPLTITMSIGSSERDLARLRTYLSLFPHEVTEIKVQTDNFNVLGDDKGTTTISVNF